MDDWFDRRSLAPGQSTGHGKRLLEVDRLVGIEFLGHGEPSVSCQPSEFIAYLSTVDDLKVTTLLAFMVRPSPVWGFLPYSLDTTRKCPP